MSTAPGRIMGKPSVKALRKRLSGGVAENARPWFSFLVTKSLIAIDRFMSRLPRDDFIDARSRHVPPCELGSFVSGLPVLPDSLPPG